MKTTGWFPRVHIDTAKVCAVGQAGGVLLTETIRAAGLDRGLSEALSPWRKPLAVHDPGKIIMDLALSLVLGGEALSDVDALRAEPGVYGRVASDPTVSRLMATLAQNVDKTVKAISTARQQARARVWNLAGVHAPNHCVSVDAPLVIDLDASLVTAHSDKQQAAPTFKRGFGFHPLPRVRRPRAGRDRRVFGGAPAAGECWLEHRRGSRRRDQGGVGATPRLQSAAGSEGPDPR